jgi:hypothetical protein
MENKIDIQEIAKLDVHAAVKEIKLPGDDEPTKVLITKVSFEYEGRPGMFDDLLATQAADHRVDVAFSSPQLVLDVLRAKRQNGEV